jgi:putative ABC transport system permease protein
MFSYYMKLGALSIRKNPILSSLMVAAIATGIGAFMTIVNIDYIMSGDPIPHRSSDLYYVQLDSWDPYDAYTEPNEPPDQVTYIDGTNLWKAAKGRRQVLSFRTGRVVQPDGDDQLPFPIETRSTTADFFAMFDTPFLYGSGWSKASDDNTEFVVVLGRELNERVFGGENSVGKSILMNGSLYRIAGVLDTWDPMPRFYDVTNGPFRGVEEAFFPFSVAITEDMHSNGNTNCWKMPDAGGREAFLNSECVWMQMWVELHGADERAEYLAYLDGYVASQKELGRFPRPLNNRLSNVMEWMENQEVVRDDVQVLLGLAGLFLVVCLLNTIGLLLAKVLRRSGDISLRRALGASRQAIFSQYIVEAGMIGLAGGVLGIGMTWLGLQGIRILYSELSAITRLIQMDWTIIAAAVVLAILCALGASLYPTWRACGVHPASQLKTL